MCNCKRYQCSITLEITTSGANVSLPESNKLRRAKVVGIEVPRVAGATLYSPTGAVLAADTVTMSSYLNIVTANGTQVCPAVPMTHLMRDYNAPDPFPVQWQEIDPTQCSIQVGTSAAGYNVAHSMLITFWIDCDACGVPD